MTTSPTGARGAMAVAKTSPINIINSPSVTVTEPKVDSGGLPVLGAPVGRGTRYVGKTGAQILLAMLIEHGVTDAFGYPGGVILPTFDALYDSPINFVLVRHEQGAGHMAMAMRGRRASLGW